MKRTQIPIPSGCKEISIEQDGDKIVMVIEKVTKDFMSDITGCYECPPELGDLAIFWNKGKEWKAIVSFLDDYELAAEYMELPYKARNQEWYGYAIKFRNPEQFDKILKYKPNVTKKEDEIK
jgi:hypothetical protein|nr:MAG TPA: hypothetical protein [Caudoviricetes sp.]